jgi:hypothetical protein
MPVWFCISTVFQLYSHGSYEAGRGMDMTALTMHHDEAASWCQIPLISALLEGAKRHRLTRKWHSFLQLSEHIIEVVQGGIQAGR